MMDMGHGYICPNPQNVQIPKINTNVNGGSSFVNKCTTWGEMVLVKEVKKKKTTFYFGKFPNIYKIKATNLMNLHLHSINN